MSFIFIFASSARAHERARVQNIRDFSQTKLDSEIKTPFLRNEQGDPTFYFTNSMRTISAITEKKFGRNLWLLFLTIEINATDRDETGPTEQVQIMFPLKDKNINQ